MIHDTKFLHNVGTLLYVTEFMSVVSISALFIKKQFMKTYEGMEVRLLSCHSYLQR